MANKTLLQFTTFLAPAAAIFTAGYGLSAGHSVYHLFSEPPQHSTRIFARIFNTGAIVAIPLGLVSSVSSAYLAYICPPSLQRNVYIFAATTVLATLPYTRFVMIPGIKKLIAISESERLQEKAEQTLEYRQLFKTWVGQNTVRMGMFAAGGAAALYGLIMH